MAETADVVVVGGGVNGASTAYALVSRGVKKVVLVERDALASGASGRSSALVRMHYTNEWDARLAWASYPVFRHWPELMGGRPVFTHTGFVNVVAPEFAEHLRRNVDMLRGIGVNTTAITPDELARHEPHASVEDIGAAAHEPDSGYASPVDVVEGFGRRFRELGGDLRQWTPVTRVVRQGNRVTGVETAAGGIDAGAVVVAAGAWSLRLCRQIGLPLPARSKAIDTVLVTRPPEMRDPHMIFIDNVLGTYMRPESGILTLVGVPCSEWDIDPDTLGTGLPPEAAPTGAQLLMHRFPGLPRIRLLQPRPPRHTRRGGRRGRPLPRHRFQRFRLQDRPGSRNVHGRADRRGPRQDRGYRRLQHPPLRRGQDGRGAISVCEPPGSHGPGPVPGMTGTMGAGRGAEPGRVAALAPC
jgi:sarcosine oxidase, subunit beta